MSETTLRQWAMLRCVPRAPRKKANREIREQLLDLGFDVGIRTIQRDLRRLSALFPIASDDHKPLGWSWTGTASFDLPGMDVHTAIAFRLAARYLEPLLPRATQAYLEPHFLRAAEVLDGMSARGLSAWPAKIRAIPWGFALQPPQIEQPVLEAVHEGLLKDRVLAVDYRRRGETEVRQYEANPLGLVYRDAVAYLVCTLWDYDDILQLALHRVVSATPLETAAKQRPEFDLEAYCASGAFDFLLNDAPIEVTLRCDPSVAPRFTETPVSDDQTVTVQSDGSLVVVFSAPDSSLLHAWLRSFGPFVEVLAPQGLRAEMAEASTATAAQYSSP